MKKSVATRQLLRVNCLRRHSLRCHLPAASFACGVIRCATLVFGVNDQ